VVRLAFLMAALLVGACLLPPPTRSPAADEKPAAGPANEFAKKFVVVLGLAERLDAGLALQMSSRKSLSLSASKRVASTGAILCKR
jgi:hypothetical protein